MNSLKGTYTLLIFIQQSDAILKTNVYIHNDRITSVVYRAQTPPVMLTLYGSTWAYPPPRQTYHKLC